MFTVSPSRPAVPTTSPEFVSSNVPLPKSNEPELEIDVVRIVPPLREAEDPEFMVIPTLALSRPPSATNSIAFSKSSIPMFVHVEPLPVTVTRRILTVPIWPIVLETDPPPAIEERPCIHTQRTAVRPCRAAVLHDDGGPVVDATKHGVHVTSGCDSQPPSIRNVAPPKATHIPRIKVRVGNIGDNDGFTQMQWQRSLNRRTRRSRKGRKDGTLLRDLCDLLLVFFGVWCGQRW